MRPNRTRQSAAGKRTLCADRRLATGTMNCEPKDNHDILGGGAQTGDLGEGGNKLISQNPNRPAMLSNLALANGLVSIVLSLLVSAWLVLEMFDPVRFHFPLRGGQLFLPFLVAFAVLQCLSLFRRSRSSAAWVAGFAFVWSILLASGVVGSLYEYTDANSEIEADSCLHYAVGFFAVTAYLTFCGVMSLKWRRRIRVMSTQLGHGRRG